MVLKLIVSRSMLRNVERLLDFTFEDFFAVKKTIKPCFDDHLETFNLINLIDTVVPRATR